MESWTVYKDTKNNGWWEKSDMKFYPFGHFVFTTINTCAAISQGKEKFLENEYYYLMRLNNPDYNLLMGYTDKNGTGTAAPPGSGSRQTDGGVGQNRLGVQPYAVYSGKY